MGGCTASIQRTIGNTRIVRLPNLLVLPVAVLLGAALVWHGHKSGTPSSQLSFHGLVDSAALLAVMMIPRTGSSVRLVSERSLPARQVPAVGEYLAGFTAVWFGFGLGATLLVQLALLIFPTTLVFSVLVAAAAIWQISARRRRLIEMPGRLRVAPPTGWRADVYTTLAGTMQGLRCLRTCWASMLAMAAAPNMPLMSIVVIANLSEWVPGKNPFGPRRRFRPALAYIALSAGSIFVALR